MDRRITAKFYEVVSLDGGPALLTLMQRVAEMDGKRDREKALGDDLALRLEAWEDRGDGIFVGDLTRIQTENLPGHVTDDDTEALPVTEIGHYIGFVYDSVAEVIAVQYHLQAQIGKVLSYFAAFDQGSEFAHLPLLTEKGLNDLDDGGIKKLRVKVSGMEDFEASRDGDNEEIEETLSRIKDEYGAQSIEIVLTVRRTRGSLLREPVRNQLRRLIDRSERTESIKALQAETFEGADPIDFLEHALKERGILNDLPQNRPAEARRLRFNFLYNAYVRHRNDIRRRLADEDA